MQVKILFVSCCIPFAFNVLFSKYEMYSSIIYLEMGADKRALCFHLNSIGAVNIANSLLQMVLMYRTLQAELG